MTNASKRIAFLGECMVELDQRPGDEANVLRRTIGGDSLNAAIYCRRALGETGNASVHYVTRVGDDPFGRDVPGFIRDHGVENDLVAVCPGETTGLYAISRDEAGERSFSYWRSDSAARRLFANEADRALDTELGAFDALFFSAISLAILSEGGRERLLALAHRLRDAGALVAFDGNYRPRLWRDIGEARRVIERAHRASTLSMPSFDDERALFGDRDAETCARRLLALGITQVIVKNGAEPAILAENGTIDAVPGTVPERIVDTTSAGDSFDGAALAALLAGASLAEAARAGHRMASVVIGHYGAIVAREATYWPAGPLGHERREA